MTLNESSPRSFKVFNSLRKMTNYIFNAKTDDAYVIKMFADILQSNIKTACFMVDKHGMHLRMADQNCTIMIDTVLEANKFAVYSLSSKKPLCIGVNLSNLHTMLSSIKKKDAIQFYIDEAKPDLLGLCITPRDGNRSTNSSLKILNIQNLDIEIPEGYSNPINISSSEYQKMIKSMIRIDKRVIVRAHSFQISFSSQAEGVMARSAEFGEDTSPNDDVRPYLEEFDTEQLIKISKIAGLSSNMQIFATPDLPLCFKSDIGKIGRISIYINSSIEK